MSYSKSSKREKEVFKIQQERENELLKIQEERGGTSFGRESRVYVYVHHACILIRESERVLLVKVCTSSELDAFPMWCLWSCSGVCGGVHGYDRGECATWRGVQA